jgi:hypothetical protein
MILVVTGLGVVDAAVRVGNEWRLRALLNLDGEEMKKSGRGSEKSPSLATVKSTVVRTKE